MKAFFHLFIIIPAMSIGQNTNSDTIQIVHAESKVEYPKTLTHIKSKAKSIKDWLFNICDGERPSKPIEEFILEFSKSTTDEGYRFRLYGVNSYSNKMNGNDVKIDYEPIDSNMYFIPAKKDYENLDYQQFKEKIIVQIKETLATEKLKSSFLAEAKYIYIPFSDEKIIIR